MSLKCLIIFTLILSYFHVRAWSLKGQKITNSTKHENATENQVIWAAENLTESWREDGHVKPCFVKNNETEDLWLLVWQDGFKDGNLSGWDVQQEGKFCSGNSYDHSSCNTKQNVYIQDGVLVLVAQHGEPHYSHRFTGAQISRKTSYDSGRIEIRAAQPVGQQLHTSLFVYTKETEISPQHGWMEIAGNAQKSAIYRGAHFPDSVVVLLDERQLTLNLSENQTDLSEFHVYGIEFNHVASRLFFDDQYSDWYPNLDIETLQSQSVHQLNMMIGVGGTAFHQPIPENTNLLNWICPALIVDYVRVYQKLELDHTENPLEECTFLKPTKEGLLTHICEQALEKSIPRPHEEFNLTLVFFVISLCLTLVLALILLSLMKTGRVILWVPEGLRREKTTRVGTYMRNSEPLDESLVDYVENNHHQPEFPQRSAPRGVCNDAFGIN